MSLSSDGTDTLLYWLSGVLSTSVVFTACATVRVLFRRVGELGDAGGASCVYQRLSQSLQEGEHNA